MSGPAPQTRGFLHACACPWCKKVHSFADQEDYAVQQALLDGLGGSERDILFTCSTDEKGPGCGRHFRIAKIAKVTMIWLEPVVSAAGYKRLKKT